MHHDGGRCFPVVLCEFDVIWGDFDAAGSVGTQAYNDSVFGCPVERKVECHRFAFPHGSHVAAGQIELDRGGIGAYPVIALANTVFIGLVCFAALHHSRTIPAAAFALAIFRRFQRGIADVRIAAFPAGAFAFAVFGRFGRRIAGRYMRAVPVAVIACAVRRRFGRRIALFWGVIWNAVAVPATLVIIASLESTALIVCTAVTDLRLWVDTSPVAAYISGLFATCR